VRDLDDGGNVLWIAETQGGWRPKSRAGQRRIEVPEVLRQMLLQRAQDKAGETLLFISPRSRGRRSHSWLREHTRRLCKAAGVPVVCAHALRGQHATLAIQAGATPHLVAGALGHASTGVTLGSYAMPGSEQIALARNAARVLLN
jgi:integrase